MNIEKNELIELVQTVVDATIKGLVDKGLLGKSANASSKSASASKEKTAYQQTESLLFNYRGFQKIVREREQEIDEIRKYGVLQRGSVVVQYGNKSGIPQGIVLDEELIEKAVANIEKSMESMVQAIALIDSGMKALANDPYYSILEMRYFDGRTQEDIAIEFNCSQPNIAYHKSRLVKELSLKLFPEKVVSECLS